MIEKPDTLTQEIMDLFKKKFPKRVDRDVWICKYMMALTDIHLIEGLIGRRQKLRKSNLILDGNPGNNNIENLFLFPRNSTHLKYHFYLRWMVRVFLLGHDQNTFLKAYGSSDVFSKEERLEIRKIVGDIYE